MEALTIWLANTQISQAFQNAGWFVPTIQTIHIMAIAIVVSSVGMLDLRLLGLTGKSRSVVQTARQFMPWIWSAVVVLAITGSLLIVTEPARELLNKVFWLKMSTLVVAIIVTIFFQLTLKKNMMAWDSMTPTPISGKITAVISLILWTCIVIAGRWIAYT